MNTNRECVCLDLKKFKPVRKDIPVTYQCSYCKKIYLQKDINEDEKNIIGIQSTDNPFKYYVRLPEKKDN